MNTPLDPRLSHLSPEELESLIARYYANKDRVDDLIREYNIDCIPGKLSSLFPEQTLDNHRCRYCDVPMIQFRLSRSGGSSQYAYCPECKHQSGNNRCKCWKCTITVDRRTWYQQYDSRYDLIGGYARRTWPETFFSGAAFEIDFFSAVSLLALVHACLFLELRDKHVPKDYPLTLNALSSANVPFTPTDHLSGTLINFLMNSTLIGISELSENDAFAFENGSISGYYLTSTRWTLTIQNAMGLIHGIEDLSISPKEWPADWHLQINDLWKLIAVSECQQFYTYCSEQRGLPIAEKTSVDDMLTNLLQDYSVAQCYRIIYAAAQKTADLLVCKQPHPNKVANYMVGECQQRADRARTEKWEVKAFRRDYHLPRTTLSYVLFDVFLGIGEEGFTSVPGSTVQSKIPEA